MGIIDLDSAVAALYASILLVSVRRYFAWHVPILAPQTFSAVAYLVLLPPIIFHAAYTMKTNEFCQNMGTILCLAFPGTLLTGLIVALGLFGASFLVWPEGSLYDCLATGAVLSAIDTVATLAVLRELKVDPMLHSLVFGESVLNDAAAITLFHSIEKLGRGSSAEKLALIDAWHASRELILSSTLSVFFGILVGLGCSFFMKRVRHYELSSTYEIAVLFIASYLAYTGAQAVSLSGVLALFVCAALLSHCAFYSVSKESQVTLHHISGTLSLLADTTMFISVGLTLFAKQEQPSTYPEEWNILLTIFALVLLVVARAVVVFSFIWISNCMRTREIPWRYAFLMFYANLRGGVALILALNVRGPARQVIINLTYVVVLITNTLIGATTKPLAQALRIPTASDIEVQQALEQETQLHAHSRPTYEPTEWEQNSRLFRTWVKIDEKWIKPTFGGNPREP